jgi:ABC-type multidrug transport system ATPase subunit
MHVSFCRIAYVRQEDIFFSQLTVRETLSLAAELQLPDTMSPERKEKYVNDLLFRLGLVSDQKEGGLIYLFFYHGNLQDC